MNYRLKKEARQFFDNFKTDVNTLEIWGKRNVHENLLEKVEKVYVTYGKQVTSNTTSLKSYDHNPKKAIIHFDLHINDCESEYYENFDEAALIDAVSETIKNFVK